MCHKCPNPNNPPKPINRPKRDDSRELAESEFRAKTAAMIRRAESEQPSKSPRGWESIG